MMFSVDSFKVPKQVDGAAWTAELGCRGACALNIDQYF